MNNLKKNPIILAIVLLLASVNAFADRGMIRPARDINIEEPAQRAVIAHNGREELLILQTDVKADEETRIVEFMPLPSKPEVSLAPEECFKTLAEIVRKHHLQYYSTAVHRGRTKMDEAGEAVTVVVSSQLGPHDVTVVEVRQADDFIGWVREFFREKGLGEPSFDKELNEIVAGYLERDVSFFAFDIVAVSPERKTVAPLAYTFDSPRMFYPLVVSNLFEGRGTIELFTILPQGMWSDIRDNLLSIAGGAESKEQVLWSRNVLLDDMELKGLHRRIPELFGDHFAYLSAVRYEGLLEFDRDISQPVGLTADIRYAAEFFVELFEEGNAVLMESIVGLPFVFGEKAVYADRLELLERLKRAFKEAERIDLSISTIDYLEAPKAIFPPVRWKFFWPVRNQRAESFRKILDRYQFTRDFVKDHQEGLWVVDVRFADGTSGLVLLRQDPAGSALKVAGFSFPQLNEPGP